MPIVVVGGGLPGVAKSRKGSVESGREGFGHCTAVRGVEGEVDEIPKGNRKSTVLRVARAAGGGICESEERQGLLQGEPCFSAGLEGIGKLVITKEVGDSALVPTLVHDEGEVKGWARDL